MKVVYTSKASVEPCARSEPRRATAKTANDMATLSNWERMAEKMNGVNQIQKSASSGKSASMKRLLTWVELGFGFGFGFGFG